MSSIIYLYILCHLSYICIFYVIFTRNDRTTTSVFPMLCMTPAKTAYQIKSDELSHENKASSVSESHTGPLKGFLKTLNSGEKR